MPTRFAITLVCTVALLGRWSGAQQTAADLNARRAAEHIGAALIAYHDMRMVVLGDTTKFDLCSATYRSVVPLAATGRERIAEVVGSSRRSSCEPSPTPAPAALSPHLRVDSVTMSLTRAKAWARIRRGEYLYSEEVDLETGMGLGAERWVVKSIRLSDVVRLKS